MEFSVYIVSNPSMTLYVGMTNDIGRRVAEHKLKETRGFTSRYHFDRLVWFENFSEPGDAIAREKELKGWSRARKVALIKKVNPEWEDLSRDW